jgi:hypothetical protein
VVETLTERDEPFVGSECVVELPGISDISVSVASRRVSLFQLERTCIAVTFWNITSTLHISSLSLSRKLRMTTRLRLVV